MGGAFSAENEWQIEAIEGQVSIIGINSEYPIGQTQKVFVSGPPVALTLAVDNAVIRVNNNGNRITIIGERNTIEVVGNENRIRVHGEGNTFSGAGEGTFIYTDDEIQRSDENTQFDIIPLTVDGNICEDAPPRMSLLDQNNNPDDLGRHDGPQDGNALIRFVYYNFSPGDNGSGDAPPPPGANNADLGGAGDANSGRPSSGLKRDQDGDDEEEPSSKKLRGD